MSGEASYPKKCDGSITLFRDSFCSFAPRPPSRYDAALTMDQSTGNAGLRAVLARLPKIDLHRHLEGSLRLSSLFAIAQAYDLDLPARSPAELQPFVQIG